MIDAAIALPPPAPAIIRPQSQSDRASILPGHVPVMFIAGAAQLPAASYVFNGLDQLIERVLSTVAPNRKTFTVSYWLKILTMPPILGTDMIWQTRIDADNRINQSIFNSGSSQILGSANTTGGSSDFTENPATDYNTNIWYHMVLKVDTSLATAGDRVIVYRDNAALAPSGISNPSLNFDTQMFAGGATMGWGAVPIDRAQHLNCKIAFIDVVEGLALTPSSFGFSDGGVWTRKPYAGSYGAHGFSLDGTAGFSDVSGNGQNFTPVNMDASNLDPLDLPPHTL
jgi:hypothetical protein